MFNFDIKVLESCFKQHSIKTSFENLYFCLGFITAVASGPEEIDPAEWIEQLLLSEANGFDNAANSDNSIKLFTKNLVTWWNQCCLLFDSGGTIKLPRQINLTPTGKPNKALVEFSVGYLDGFDWIFDTWKALLPEEDLEANRTLSVLNFILARFIDPKSMQKSEPELYQQLPDTKGCFRVLPNLLSGVGMLGQDLALDAEEPDVDFNPIFDNTHGDGTYDQAFDESFELSKGQSLISKQQAVLMAEKITNEPAKDPYQNIGRNDPCPCGSDKKFKKCCLH